MPSNIDPSQTKWRYFFRDENGEVKITDNTSETPPDLNKVALLTTSVYFSIGVDPNLTPARMKFIVEDLLKNHQANFCIALPVEEGHGAWRYDQTKIPAGCEEYHDAVMHDGKFCGEMYYVSAKKGAEQIASAIENGFHISQMAGGTFLDHKIPLVREYFREHPLPENHCKKVFSAFSNGSAAGFGLRELTNYVCNSGIGKLCPMPSTTDPIRDEKVARQTVELFEAKQDYPIVRELQGGDFAEVQARYEEAKHNGYKIRHIAYWPRELVINNNSPYRVQFNKDEKIILGLEAYLQVENGFNAHEALFRALESGAIDPKQVLCIVVENLIGKQEEALIRRIDGKIPNYEDLTNTTFDEAGKVKTIGEKDIIVRLIAQNMGLSLQHLYKLTSEENRKDLVVDYIAKSNQAYENEAQRIKEVATRFGIPVVFGGKTRAGHALDFVVQPSNVEKLELKDGIITETATVKVNDPVEAVKPAFDVREIRPLTWPNFGLPLSEEDSIILRGRKVEEARCAYTKNPLLQQNPAIDQKFSEIKLLKLNENQAVPNLTDCEILGGNPSNLSEQPLEKLSGKGLFCMMAQPGPDKGSGINGYMESLLHSGKLGKSIITPDVDDVPFIILSLSDQDKQNYGHIIKGIIEQFEVQAPIFFTNKTLSDKDLPPIFSANINLEKMLEPGLDAKNPESHKVALADQIQK